ncbi:saxitoxin and tetrodotoxin-binding protein 1-like [Mugil cephalus]|uniref:saxitoxin and tetrodotoxin-binding protein 1-like n=1 Tax=Mugil cephalus TaxID=48193 RepID=UPI001FB85812|nr:saxitoxin and tetrodotoxin-binding protein 1-like [Mugil cephalus]
MAAVKPTVLLLLMVVVGFDAAPPDPDCEGLAKRMPTKDLHQLFGDWVLVWSVADYDPGSDLLVNVTSSHVELRLQHDNKTIEYNERNMFTDGSCVTYFFNLTLPSDSDSEHHTLRTDTLRVEKDGVPVSYNESAEVEFYASCADCLMMTYRHSPGRFLLLYKREGLHRDAELLKAAHADHRKQAECLGLPHGRAFAYDGAADFCHKKSAPDADPVPS